MNLHPSFVTSEHTLSLLSNPGSFIPTPTKVEHRRIADQVTDFIRRLQWQHAFVFSGSKMPRFGYRRSSRWPPRSLVPEYILTLTNKILASTKCFLQSPHACFSSNNLELAERCALEVLKGSDDVTVRPADKGGRWIIMKTSHYNAEALRQLQDVEFYEPLNRDVSLFTKQRLDIMLQTLYQRKFITRRELRFLSPESDNSERKFYLLPKLHKDEWPSLHVPPGRPIVSDVNSVSYNCSKILEFFLNPLCCLQESHLRDTGHVIAILRDLQITSSDLLFTMDIKSLYTNVPIDEGVEVVANLFRNHPDPKRPDRSLLSLLRLLLSTNTFRFGASSLAG